MTDMIGVSRRGAIALAGIGTAGLALAGCKGSNSISEPAKIGGFDPPFGEDPNPPAVAPAEVFAPLALTLVRITSAANFGLDINYTSIKSADGAAFSTTDSEREKIAAKWFKKLVKVGGRKKFREIADDVEKLHRFRNGARDVENFENFGSNGKSEFYFWIDSTQVEFVKRKKANPGDPERFHLVSFSQFLSDDGAAKPNKSFFARPVNGTGLPGLVFAVRNFFRGEDGKDMTPGQTAVKHAMNLHFKAKANGNLWIPMVIDPDTGNGVGYEP